MGRIRSSKPYIYFLVGLLPGISLSYFNRTLYGSHPVHFKGLVLHVFIFQMLVSFAEEYLYRAGLQRYLQDHIPRWSAVLLLSASFGVMHGLNPVLYDHLSFDWHWASVSFMVSFLAGIMYGKAHRLSGAYGIHLGWNLVSSNF